MNITIDNSPKSIWLCKCFYSAVWYDENQQNALTHWWLQSNSPMKYTKFTVKYTAFTVKYPEFTVKYPDSWFNAHTLI